MTFSPDAYGSLSPVAKLRTLLALDDAALLAVQRYGAVMSPRLPEVIERFYGWMEPLDDFKLFFSNPARLAAGKQLQLRYWQDFFEGKVDDGYLRRRREVGETHARVGVNLASYLAGMDVSLSLLLEDCYDQSLSAAAYLESARAVRKLVHFDTTVTVETYSHLVGKRMADQTHALLAMSTPVTALWEGILLLPIIGFVDSQRAQDIMQSSLARIADTRAKVFIIDISGVSVVDTAVANHLIKVAQASRLMGCVCILSGLSPEIAQTIVELGIPVNDLCTTSTLRNALEIAFKTAGVAVQQLVAP